MSLIYVTVRNADGVFPCEFNSDGLRIEVGGIAWAPIQEGPPEPARYPTHPLHWQDDQRRPARRQWE